MSGNSLSFTLDDSERERILGLPAGPVKDLRSGQTPLEPCSVMPVCEQARGHTQVSLKPGNPVVFDFKYSQSFTQTQEDTSSFRRQIDAAPPMEKPVADGDDIFGMSPPLAASTAREMHHGNDTSSSPSIRADDSEEGSQTNGSASVKSPQESQAQTPGIRYRSHETPGGLTQMFQSSQDTPILRHRKSTYVSMKDSQQNKCNVIADDAESGDDDPDFPKIRKSSPVERLPAAHAIMDRLRDRTLTEVDTSIRTAVPVDKETVIDGRAPRYHDLDISVIPASAPLQSQHDAELQDGTSIITDSQPQHITQVQSTPIGTSARPDAEKFEDTIQFNLPSSFPGTQYAEDTVSPIPTQDNVQEPVVVGVEADIVPRGHETPTRPKLSNQDRSVFPKGGAQSSSPPLSRSSIRTGQRQKPIVLKDTPMAQSKTLLEPTTVFREISSPAGLRRSASYSIPTTVSPENKSSKDIERSKSMTIVPNPAQAQRHDLSSPILQAGDRRRSRRPPVISESPLARDTAVLPRKRPARASQSTSTPQQMSAKSSDTLRAAKRVKTEREIADSQSLQQRSGKTDVPEQPILDHYQSQQVEATLGRSTRMVSSRSSSSEEESHEIDNSSPLTSLASQDFMEETLPSLPVKARRIGWSRRVFALHRETQAYYPGSIGHDTFIGDPCSESTMVYIKFDDSDETEIEFLYVRPLDLRPGDTVKVNLPGIKTKQHIIESLHSDHDREDFTTDIRGHTTFTARQKGNGSVATFSIDQIYLPHSLMKPFLKRGFPSLQNPVLADPITPSRRAAARTRESSPALSIRGSQANKPLGLFAGFAFSVTTTEAKLSYRDRVERKVVSNGGILMSDGLEELFEDSPFSEDRDIAPLRLNSTGRNLKAAVVISDNPSRRVKYLQALSLGIPCLHFTYVDDCIAARRILDIQPYLLAAGEGLFGDYPVTLSMTCTFPAFTTLTNTSLQTAIRLRRKIYAGKTIILVTDKSPALRTARRIHFFLCWAMGCDDLTECATLEEAHHLLLRPEDGKRWDLVSVQSIDHADASVDGMMHDLAGHVVTNEDVVQSLITGRLCRSY